MSASDVNPSDASSDERSMSDAKLQNTPKTLSVESIEKVSNYFRSLK